MEWHNGNFLVTTDVARFDVTAIHAYLSQESYWARNISFDLVEKSVENSLSFGLLDAGKQIGFARVVTDRATYAYVMDVYVLQSHRRRGLATWMIKCVLAHPDLQGLRKLSLSTRDMHALYRKFGFSGLEHPDRAMELRVVRRYA